MVANASKFQVILLGGCSIGVANSVILLGVTTDARLQFNQHIIYIPTYLPNLSTSKQQN